MQTTTETQDGTLAGMMARATERAETLRAELAVPALMAYNWVLVAPEAEGGWCVVVDADRRTARLTPTALRATRWTEADARRIAADELAAWKVEARPYREQVRRELARAVGVVEGLEAFAAQLGRS